MKNQFTSNSVYDTTIRLFILILIVGWCLMIMMPFVSIILWSLILGMALHPLHKTMAKKLGNSPKIASALLVLTMLLIVILPVGLLVGSLVEEVKELKVMYTEGKLFIPPPTESVKTWPIIGEDVDALWQAASVNIESTLLKYQDQLTTFGKALAKGVLSSVGAIGQFVIAFIIAGILLVIPGIGENIRMFFRKVAGENGDDYADITLKTVGSVVKGVLGVALVLALLHGIIFMIAGVPFAGIWTLLVFVLCVLQLPVIFITLPVVAYIFSTNEVGTAIMWTVLLLIAGLSDNVLKPILLGKGAPVPMLVIFIGVIGGFIFSGFIGLFTGAIVLSIGYKLFVGWINPEKLEGEAAEITGENAKS